MLGPIDFLSMYQQRSTADAAAKTADAAAKTANAAAKTVDA